MGSSALQLVFYFLAGCAFGVLIGWSIQAVIGKRRVVQLSREYRGELNEVTRQKTEFADAYAQSQSTVEQLEAAYAERNAEFKSTLKKAKLLAKNVRTLRAEREDTKIKVGAIQNALTSLRNQTTRLRSEFDKSRDFYKRELLKALKKRKNLEEDVRKAQAEQEAFAKAVESSVLEHGNPENMVMAAQLRLGQLDVLERTVNKLEAENEQLRQDARQMKDEFAERTRDLADLEELRLHNAQLVRCVEALEDSRKAYEADAERFREQAGESEKLSDTLRLKLEDLEKNFADMEQEQHEALEDARDAAVVPILRKQG